MDPFSDDDSFDDVPAVEVPVDTGDDLGSFLEFAGVSTERPSLRKPWMKFHKFNLVKTVEEVAAIVDKAIAHGRCALDLETEGFDNRIDYDEENRPSTRHQIVGYCLSVKGVGYYIPVRHLFNPRMGERDPNVPRAGVEAEMRRLLQAARPEVEGEPYVHNVVPAPKVVIYFWNSKFDQEFLYAVTGIDIWHPVSFEDGMLAAYSIYSDDDLGLKSNAVRRLAVYDGDTKIQYEMIELPELFPSNTKKADRKMATLYPEDDSDVVLYGCSDAICTELLCETKGEWEFALPKVKYEYKEVVSLAKAKHDFTYRLEKRTVQGVRDMERRRVLEDKQEIAELLKKAEVELERYRSLIVDLAAKHGFENFNPASPIQLSDFLFEKNGLDLHPKPEKGASGQYTTSADVLEALYESIDDAPKVLEWIVKYRQVEKIIGTYLKSMLENCDEHDQLRFKFNQTGAATGRFTASSGEPDHGYAGIPIQGIPARDDPKKPEVAQSLRRAFIARTGYTLVKIDYAGQELRIVSNISKEPKWVNEFLNASKEGREADLHTLTAKAFFGEHITRENKKERNMGKCVHPDTLVASSKGLVPIKSLGDFGNTEGFVDAPDGLLVDGNPVVQLYNGGVKPLFHVVTRYGVLTCTAEHRFVMADGSLVRAGDLQVTQALETPPPKIERLVEPQGFEWATDQLSDLGAFLVRANAIAIGSAWEVRIDGEKYTVVPSQGGPNRVLGVFPAGEGLCLDLTLGTKEHLYRANGLLTHNTANFALIYGGGTGAIMRATKCDKVEAARRKQNFDKSVPVFAAWVKGQHSFVKKHKGVYTAFKRFIAIPDAGLNAGDIDSYGKPVQEQDVGKIRAACERKSTNYPIQGCLNFNSLVMTRTGQQPIGHLVNHGIPFEVWLGDQWVEAAAYNMGACELAEIQLKDGTTIDCDTRHKLLIVTDEGQDWVEYKDLQPGMRVATALCESLEYAPSQPMPPMPQRIQRSPVAAVVPTVAPSKYGEFWYWIGRYVGDGWLDPRGGLTYFFGDHERPALERCKAFWREAGLNPQEDEITHTPHTKTSTRYRLTIWSVNLYDWLLQLGLKEGVTAHTKRCPERIFSETLEHRKAFLKGVMESDGHKPKLPLKIDGVWDRKSKKGNPFNVHLCQRPLLVDLKRLLRTVGVESVVRGPYRSGADKDGNDTTSYRLDIQRRMYESNVEGKSARLPKFNDMDAPKFLVENFLSKGPFPKSSFGGNESAYNLYLRLQGGGCVSVYTLKYLCSMLNVELDYPIYGYKRLVSKTALGRVEDTYTLHVKHALHRFESDGVITKNSGADIMKLSLTLLLKEFILRGWRKEGGDDSVRVLMTVHDELVFEIRHDRLMEALPIIIEHMESPSKFAGWQIPLVVEPLVSLSWEAKYDWLKILKGEEPVPEWLVDYVKPGVAFVPKPKEAPKATGHATASVPPPPKAMSDRPPPKPVTGTVTVATFVLGRHDILSEKSVRVVFNAVSGAIDPDSGVYLRLVTQDGDVLVDVNDRFFVIPELLQINLNERLAGSIYHEVKEEAS